MRDHLRRSRLETILNVAQGYASGCFKPAALHLMTPPSPHLLYPLTRAPRFYEEHKKEKERYSVHSAYQRSDWCVNGWAIG